VSYGGVYHVVQRGISWTAALEAIFIQAAADHVVAVHEVRITQGGDVTSQQAEWVIARTATDNSAAGTANTPRPTNFGQVAAGATYRHTITASLSALTQPLIPINANALHEWRWVPSMLEKPIILSPAGTTARRLTVQTLDTPSPTLVIDIYMMVEEIGG
jgi:hypothetical protein